MCPTHERSVPLYLTRWGAALGETGWVTPIELAHDDVGDGEALVFLHGIGSDRTRWQPIVELLAGDFRCVSVDLPGHGDSPPEGCDALSTAMAVAALTDALGLAHPVLVGHSLGGVVSLVVGALHPPRSVIAVDPVPLHLRHLTERLAPLRDRLLGDDFAAAFAEFEATLGPDLVPEPRRSAILDGFHPDAAVVRSYWAGLLDPAGVDEAQAAFAAALAGVAVPTLVLLAEPPTTEDAELLGTLPDATVEVFAGMGHYLHLVDPDRFADRVRAWVAAAPGQGTAQEP